jgi:tetratricopeptide (TPR) repeat protein
MEAYIHLSVNRLDLFRAMRRGAAACETARRLAATHADAALALAQCEAEEGRTREALAGEWRSAQMDPSGTFLVYFLAWDLAAQGDWKRAWEIAGAGGAGPEEYEGLLLRARLALIAGDDQRAAAFYQRAIALGPDRIEALLGMGEIREKQDPREALEYYRRARAMDPALALATDALCGGLAAAKDPQAADICELANLQDPSLAAGWKNLGRVLLAKKDRAGAGKCLAHAALLTPEDRELKEWLESARSE